MLHLPEIDLKQTLVYQEALVEGRQEGEAALVLRQLRHRFGVLDPQQG